MLKFRSIYARIVIILLILTAFSPMVKAYSADSPKKQILILNSYHYGDFWEDNLNKGINSTLLSKIPGTEIHTEYMDARKYGSPEYIDKLHEFYKYKYNTQRFDLIISADNDAFDFLIKYHNEIFPDTPIAFCGVNNFNDSMLNGDKLFTGVSEETDTEGTLRIAVKLHPNAERAIIITDKSLTGQAVRQSVIDAIPKLSTKIYINMLDYTTIDEVEDYLRSVPKNSFIFIVGSFTDRFGISIPMAEVTERLSKNFDIPIYSNWDLYINHGIVGGRLTSGVHQGELVSNVALKILNGQSPSQIPIVKEAPGSYVFDYNQLKRFNIPLSLLPLESIIENRPNHFYSIPKDTALGLILFVMIVQIVIIVIFLNNISKRKHAETAVLESAEQLRTLINASPDIICFKDDKGRWLETNQFTLELFELQGVDYVGKTDSDFIRFSPPYVEAFISSERSDAIAWESGAPYRAEEIVVKPDGTKYIFDTLKVPVFNSDGNRKGIVILGRDITEHKRNEELKKKALENKRLLNEAMEYDKLKIEFFANISHELRTPLNIVLSTLQLLDMYIKKGYIVDNGAELDKRLGGLKQNSFRLLRLVNNLIDITKMDSGFFQLNTQNLNIISVVEEITLSVAEYIENKGIALIFDTDVEEKMAACDPDKIERIMLNLLSNAVKFTPKDGRIFVNIYDNDESIKISIKDTGIGIPLEKQQIIFERFRQVDKSLTRNREGSGIGLSLVKSLVELHGGSVSVISSLGEGSEFILNLPTIPLDECAATLELQEVDRNYREKFILEFSDIYS